MSSPFTARAEDKESDDGLTIRGIVTTC